FGRQLTIGSSRADELSNLVLELETLSVQFSRELRGLATAPHATDIRQPVTNLSSAVEVKHLPVVPRHRRRRSEIARARTGERPEELDASIGHLMGDDRGQILGRDSIVA